MEGSMLKINIRLAIIRGHLMIVSKQVLDTFRIYIYEKKLFEDDEASLTYSLIIYFLYVKSNKLASKSYTYLAYFYIKEVKALCLRQLHYTSLALYTNFHLRLYYGIFI